MGRDVDIAADRLPPTAATSPGTALYTYPYDEFDDMDPPSISGLFKDAALYNQVLAENEPYGQITLPLASQSVHSFAALVGDDLDPTEKEYAGRFAQLSIDNWEPQDTEDGVALSEEPETLSEEETSSSSESHEDTPDSSVPGTFDSTTSATTEQSVTEDDLPVLLDPKETVSLLRQEFGPLGPEGEETLVCQVDGAIMQDVVILVRISILHVTHSSQAQAESRSIQSVTGHGSPYNTPDHISCVFAEL